MVGVLAARPGHFHTMGEAIEWAMRSGMCKNRDAAAVSLPSQLSWEAEDVSLSSEGVETTAGKFVWRTPLEKSQPFWEGWYRGLSEEFLKVTCPKMLLLAGTDRLDKSLAIGQMQGEVSNSFFISSIHPQILSPQRQVPALAHADRRACHPRRRSHEDRRASAQLPAEV